MSAAHNLAIAAVALGPGVVVTGAMVLVGELIDARREAHELRLRIEDMTNARPCQEADQ